MQIQRVQSNQTHFGVTVRFKPETIKMLSGNGKDIHNIVTLMESIEDNALMIVSHRRENRRKTKLVARLYEQRGDKFFMSEPSFEKPLYNLKDVKLLPIMYQELKERLVELK